MSSPTSTRMFKDYQQLNPLRKQIRLIRIHANSQHVCGVDADLVRCTLEPVDLADANPFYALSYPWGPKTPKTRIEINGHISSVRENLASFLRVLRDQFCSSSDRTICVWADSLCIDQSNLAERSLQVSMMGGIYQAADSVYGWLGEPQDPLDQDMDTVNRIDELRSSNIPWIQIPQNLPSGEARLDFIGASPYWSRLWIKQEVLLAKDLWFFYGSYFTNWKNLHFAASLLHEKTRTNGFSALGYSRARGKHVEEPQASPLHEAMVSLLNERALPASHATGLPELVSRFRNAECYDPRDQIYALISLIDLETRKKIIVDYSKPLFQVLLDNYPYWTGEELSYLLDDAGERRHPLHQYQTFCSHMTRFLGVLDIKELRRSLSMRKSINVKGLFKTFALVEVERVEIIATVHPSSVHPYSAGEICDQTECGYVLRIGTRTLSRWSPTHRVHFVYSSTVPLRGDLTGRIGSAAFFFREVETNNHESRLCLISHGIEAPSRSNRPLSTDILPHPCLWLRRQLQDAEFSVLDLQITDPHKPRLSHKHDDGLVILCNAAAMITLLLEFTMKGSHLHEEDTQHDIPAAWSPYEFGIRNQVLDPCRACRCRASKMPSRIFQRRDNASRQDCGCRWLGEKHLELHHSHSFRTELPKES